MAAPSKTAVREGRPIAAWAIESAREYAGMGRTELAEALTQRLGRPYNYDAIKELEIGKRRTAKFDEVVAVSEITGIPLRWFQTDPSSQSGWYGDSPSDQGFPTLSAAA